MIYLDNAATTRTYPEANEILFRVNDAEFYNASALYAEAVDVARSIRRARETVSEALRAGDGEVYFVSGGTEADNTALFCTRKPKGSRIIVSAGEHDAIINPASVLKEQGFDVVTAPIDGNGAVNVEEFAKLLTPETSLVSIMHVSNQTGAINDIKSLVALTR